MSGNVTVVVGDRGRMVLPAEVRARHGIESGTRLVLVEAEGGLVLFTREQLRDRIRAQLAGENLVDELIAERREAAVREDSV